MSTDGAIGRWVRRLDGERKVRGAATYAGDVQVPGKLHGRLVVSPYAHARILGIDKSAAEAVPGVICVCTASDLPLTEPEGLTRSRDPLARERVYFQGHPVAAVVAVSEAVAQDAADLVAVEYEELEAGLDPEQVFDDPRPLVHDAATLGLREDAGAHTDVGAQVRPLDRPANAASAQRFQRGDVDQGFAEADVVIERTYRTAWVHQTHLEPQSCLVVPDATGGITVYSSTQAAFFTRTEVARALGIAASKVTVITPDVGGAFGAKYALIDPLVAGLARHTGRPVQLVYTRNDEFVAGSPAPGTIIRLKTGAKRDGTLTALEATVLVDTGSYPGGTSGIVSILLGGTYRWPHLRIDAYDVLTNRPGCGAYRAPGAPQACFAVEGQMAEMAQALKLDPLAFRRQNAVTEGDEIPGGSTLPAIGSREVLEALRDHPSWQRRGEKAPGEGIGIAFAAWPGGTQPASAACKMNEDGTLTIVVGSADINDTRTGFGLLAASAFGIEPDQVDIVTGDTNSAPFAGASGGSKITYTVGAAVMKAAQEARRQVLAIAAEELEASPEDLEIVNGEVQVRGVPNRGIGLRRIAAMTAAFGGQYEPVIAHAGRAPSASAPGFAAHLARVHVDQDTGAVRVLEYVAVQDVGRAINPAGIHGQMQGGVAQGIGWGLYEAIEYDANGQVRTGSLADYAVPTFEEVPPMETVLVEVPSPEGPLGARGVGEPPIVPGAAAIANAIYDAVGVRPVHIPVTPETLLASLPARSAGGS